MGTSVAPAHLSLPVATGTPPTRQLLRSLEPPARIVKLAYKVHRRSAHGPCLTADFHARRLGQRSFSDPGPLLTLTVGCNIGSECGRMCQSKGLADLSQFPTWSHQAC